MPLGDALPPRAAAAMQSDEADDGSDNEECLQPPCRTPLRDVPVPLTNSNKKRALEGVTIAGRDSKKQAGNSTSAAVRHQPALISPDIAQKEPECTASTASEPAGGGGRTAVEEPSASLPIIIITAPIMKEALNAHQVMAMATTYGIRGRVGARKKSKDELIAELVGMNLSTPLPGCPAWPLLYASLALGASPGPPPIELDASVDRLRKMCTSRGLLTKGSKVELVQRLRDWASAGGVSVSEMSSTKKIDESIKAGLHERLAAWAAQRPDVEVPSKEDKTMLAHQSGVQVKWVEYWFWNRNKRARQAEKASRLRAERASRLRGKRSQEACATLAGKVGQPGYAPYEWGGHILVASKKCIKNGGRQGVKNVIGSTVFKAATDAILGQNENDGWFEQHANSFTSQVRRNFC